nr:sugar ABC transporter permease [Corynebacterium mendelii]
MFALPFFLFFLVSFIIPIISSAYSSLFTKKLTDGGFGPEKLVFTGLDNYTQVLGEPAFWSGLVNVAEYGVIKIPLVMISALALALLLDSLAASGVKTFRLLYFLPYAIPGVVGAILWTNLYSPNLSPFNAILGLFGTDSSLFTSQAMLNPSMANMTAWTFVGYNMIIFMATLKSVPHELYEAARIDGASEWQIVWRIKLPMLRGAAVITVLMSIIGTVQWFNEPVVMRTTVPTISSDYTPMMMAYQQAFDSQDMGLASATSILMALIAGVLAAVWLIYQASLNKKNTGGDNK